MNCEFRVAKALWFVNKKMLKVAENIIMVYLHKGNHKK
jgi:hypothetical protein